MATQVDLMVVEELGHVRFANVCIVAFLKTSDELVDVGLCLLILFVLQGVKVTENIPRSEDIVLARLLVPADPLEEVLYHASFILEPETTEAIDNLPDTELRLGRSWTVVLDHLQKV